MWKSLVFLCFSFHVLVYSLPFFRVLTTRVLTTVKYISTKIIQTECLCRSPRHSFLVFTYKPWNLSVTSKSLLRFLIMIIIIDVVITVNYRRCLRDTYGLWHVNCNGSLTINNSYWKNSMCINVTKMSNCSFS